MSLRAQFLASSSSCILPERRDLPRGTPAARATRSSAWNTGQHSPRCTARAQRRAARTRHPGAAVSSACPSVHSGVLARLVVLSSGAPRETKRSDTVSRNGKCVPSEPDLSPPPPGPTVPPSRTSLAGFPLPETSQYFSLKTCRPVIPPRPSNGTASVRATSAGEYYAA